MDDNDISIKNLLLSYLYGEADDDTRKRVEEWRDASSEHTALFNALAKAVSDCRALGMYGHIDIDKAWHTFERNMGWRKNRTLAIIRNAAAILALPLLALSVYFGLRGNSLRPGGQEQMVEMCTGAGMTGRIVLSDSTAVILNACSSLRYPAHFSGDERRVELRGEAYFDVTKDTGRRFSVKLDNGDEVQVYGTRFAVDAYEKRGNIYTTLVEGRVGYRYTDAKGVRREQILAPDQKLTRDNSGTISLAAADGLAETAWVENKIVLDHTSLAQILDILEKKYDVDFDLTLSSVGDYTFSGGKITISSLSNVLEALSMSADFRWRYKHNDNSLSTKPIIEIY